MRIMRVKNWSKYQHYKDRSPKWIKLHRDLLDNMEYHSLSPSAAKTLVMVWLIAAEDGGELPSIKELAFRMRMTTEDASSDLSELAKAGFLETSYSSVQNDTESYRPNQDSVQNDTESSEYETNSVRDSKCNDTDTQDNLYQDASLEKSREEKSREREETETDGVSVMFESWWSRYGKPIGRAKALVKWKRLKVDERFECLAVVDRYVASTPDRQYRKNPLTYLNQRGWEDEIIERDGGKGSEQEDIFGGSDKFAGHPAG